MQDPHRRARLQVRVTFEPTRLAAEHLAAAYDQVVPLRTHVAGTPAEGAPRPARGERVAAAKEQA